MIPERFGSIIGTMTYRGVTITSHFERIREGGFFKWYFDGRIGSPSLLTIINNIDYERAGVMWSKLQAAGQSSSMLPMVSRGSKLF